MSPSPATRCWKRASPSPRLSRSGSMRANPSPCSSIPATSSSAATSAFLLAWPHPPLWSAIWRASVLKHGGMEKIGASGQSNPTRILVLADGRHIGCAEYGDPDGLPVLALHGTPGSRLMFALTDAAARDKGVRLIAPERPGYGLSHVKQAASLAQAATDVAEVADAYGFDRFALIGVSGGGPYAIAAAAANLDRVVLLALAGPVGPVADLGRQLRLSRWHRLVFNRLARSRF